MKSVLGPLFEKQLKKYFYSFLLLFGLLGFTNMISAQDTSNNSKLRISILTCDAGEDIYTIWGHTAIRVVDSIGHTDYVFNFGTFDFNTPHFLAKFMKGDLQYFISAAPYSEFLYEYEYTKRNLHEQELKLTHAEKEKWYQALQLNMVGSNRFYLYNFIKDNCTTRIKDGLFKHAPLNNYSIGIHSYREEVVSGCYKAGLGWIGLGIDLLLGAVADSTPNLFQEAFLPKLLFQKIALNPKLVVSTNHITYQAKETVKGGYPINYLIIFLLLYIFVAQWNSLITQRIARSLDILLLLLFGIGGTLVWYMSRFSMHDACHENYNLIWLHPLYLLVLPLYFISKKWTGYVGFVFFIATVLLMFASYWIPQHISKSVMIVMAIALYLQIRLVQRGKTAIYK